MYLNKVTSYMAARASHARVGHCWQAAIAVMMGLYHANTVLKPEVYRYTEGILAHPDIRPVFHGWIVFLEPGNEHIIDPSLIFFHPTPVMEDYLPIASYSFAEIMAHLEAGIKRDVISMPFIDFESETSKKVVQAGELRSGKKINMGHSTRVIDILRGP